MARNVVFVAPFPLETTLRFVRAVARLDDVRLLGVVHHPPGDPDRRLYADMERIEDPLSAAHIATAVGALGDRNGPVHRLVGILEPLQVQLAEVRARFGVPGTDPRTADLFRDKPRMKQALAAAGLPVARNRLVTGWADARVFADEVGLPLVLKPPAGMGARATFRVSGLDELRGALEGMRVHPGDPMLAEELLRGQEWSFETITLGGEPRAHSASRYLPSCLEVLENPWIQWCCLLPRDLSSPTLDAARDLGARAIRALGLADGMTHMEWFERPDGTLAIGEIAARPPGANITLMTGLAHDVDPYRAWARAVVDGELDAPWDRRFAVGCAYLRGMGRGRVVGLTGVHEVHEALGHLVAEARLPTLGAPKSDHYEGDGYVVVRDPDTEVVRAALRRIVETVRVHYG